MKKLLILMGVALIALSATAVAQWTFVRAYTPYHAPLKPNDLWGLHGVAVDPDGKIWVCPYDRSDTLTIGSGALDARREIFVFLPNGSPASFSPVKTITVGGVIDSLNHDNSARGINTDVDGNILYSSFNRVYRIDYKTGLGLAKIDPAQTGSITQVATDDAGNVFVGRVVGGGFPVKIFQPDFNFLANAVDTVRTAANIARCLTVSPDGTRLYYPVAFSTNANNKVYVYENQLGPGFGNYALVDSLFEGMQVESIAWQPRAGKAPLLWVSSGSRNNPPDDTKWKKDGRTWYGMDLGTKAIVDSIVWGATFPNNPTYDDTVIVNQSARPRGIGFTSTGDTAYVAMFLADSNSVKMFFKTPTSVEWVASSIPEEYTLSQNYPNPFNPTTEVTFTIVRGGLTTLKVYDLLGREVATLVNENLAAGTYRTKFDAARLASGSYIYRLESGNTNLTKKMLLIK